MKYIYGALAFMLLSSCFINYSYAGCGYGSNSTTGYVSKKIPVENIVLQRDFPVGGIIKTYTIQQNYDPQFGCSTPWGHFFNLGVFTSGTSINGVYASNISGVGIKVQSSYWNNTVPFTVNEGGNVYNSWDTYTISLVKTGPTSSGRMTAGIIMLTGISGYMNAWDISMPDGFSINTVACSITTPSLIFSIGDIPSSSFGSSVGTIPSAAQNTQNLGLNCDAGANINVTLQGTQNPDVSTTSVLALSGQGNADVAKGVGVQLLYNGAPLVLNNRIVLKQSAGGQETFPITARYYQTKTAVTTGKANASATLDLTYQ